MLHELERSQFQDVMPLFRGYLQDPMMYAVLEDELSGRVWVDDSACPAAAFVWTGKECAYLVGGEGNGEFQRALRQLVQETLVPAARADGREYLSVFSFPESYAAKLERLFREQRPLRTPLSTFAFDQARFRRRHGTPGRTPRASLTLKELGAEELADPRQAYLAGEVTAYWETVERFVAEGCGYCVVEDDSLVSWCYVQAFGHGAQTLDIWTAQSHRRQGLGTLVGAAVIDRCLGEGYTPFWICDRTNVASSRLAERLGFDHTGDIELVDIPFQPYDFYRDLAQYFYLPNGEHKHAAEAYERAFSVRQGEAEDYYQAALAWALAGKPDRAQEYLQKAIDGGWTNMDRIAAEPAFVALPRSMVPAPDLPGC